MKLVIKMSKLPFDERLDRAGQLIILARRFFDVWFLYESTDSRPIILEAMNRFPEFFRFDSHAHLVAMVNHLAFLYEKKKDTINFEALIKEATSNNLISDAIINKVNEKLKSVTHLRPKIKILRDKLFSHRCSSVSYEEAFRLAAITPYQFRDLTDAGISIANSLLVARGKPECFYLPSTPKQLRAMLNELLPNGLTDSEVNS